MKLDKLASTSVIVLNVHDTLNAAISHMWRLDCRHLPVVRENVPIGMVSERDVLFHVCWRSRELPGATRVERVMASPIMVLSPDDPVEKAARMMLNERISAVPLTAGDALTGIVTETDFLKCFNDDRSLVPGRKYRQASVVDHMSAHVFSVTPDDSTLAAVRVMREKHVHHVPVLNDGRLVGIVSDRDVLRGGPRDEGKRPISVNELRLDYSSNISGVMTTQLAVLDPSATLADVAQMMVARKIGALPVVHDGELAGIITETDLLRAFVHACG